MTHKLLMSIGLLLASLAGAAFAQEIGPAPVRGVQVLVAPDLVVPKHSLVAHRWALGPLTAAERESLGSPPRLLKAFKVGIHRDLPVDIDAGIELDRLAWAEQADGSRVATLEFASPEASAVRIALDGRAFPTGLTLRTYAAAQPGHLHGAVDAAALATGPAVAWLPEQPGEVLGIELHAAPGFDVRGAVLPLKRLSHLAVDKLRNLGQAGACHVDVACEPDWLEAARAVARIIFDVSGEGDDDGTFACTGTLLNSGSGDGAPLFITAEHCIRNQARASTITFYWNFERATCDGADPGAIVQTTGGAELLARAVPEDASLLLLNNPPPPTARLSGWNANRPALSSPVVTLHHPKADVKKYAAGEVTRFTDFGSSEHKSSGSYMRVRFNEGATEEGSSGAGLFNSAQQLIGTLRGGAAACDAPTLPDWYGRLERAYPSFSSWLTGDDEVLPPPPEPEPDPPPTPEPDPPRRGGGHGAGLLWLLLLFLPPGIGALVRPVR